MRHFFLCLLLFVATPALAAKVPVTWINATQNADGTPLTDLVAIRIEWGTCMEWGFGIAQSSITVAPGPQAAFIYPTGFETVCVRAYSINSRGVASDASRVISKRLFDPLGRPVTLGQPIILP